MAAEAAFEFRDDDRAPVLALRGDWTVDTIAALEAKLSAIAARLSPEASIDVAHLGRMDVAGAYLLYRTFRSGPAGADARIAIRGDHANAQRLLETARKARSTPAAAPERPTGVLGGRRR